MNRRTSIIAAFLLLLGTAVAVYLATRSTKPPGYDAIVNGMTSPEVRAALQSEPSFTNITKDGPYERYSLERGTVTVRYNRDERVTEKSLEPAPNLLERARAWWSELFQGPPATKPMIPSEAA
jgi:hypothetical protein